MIDIQNTQDYRGIEINSVGICDLRIQINICNEPSLAYVNLGVSLKKIQKGIHMSRLTMLINNFSVLSNYTVQNLLQNACKCQGASNADLELHSYYFLAKAAPISNIRGKMDYPIHIIASYSIDNKFRILHTIDVPITAVCPCSKSISSYGAHNQRGIISVTLENIDVTDYVDIIKIIEKTAPSQELFTILKRTDEKYVTENGYENPKFVEDLVRDTLINLSNFYSEKLISVKARNFESIHNHNAYAYISKEE